MSDSLQPHGLQHTMLPCPSLFPGVCSNPCPLSQWCCITVSSSAVLLPLYFLLLPSVFTNIWVFWTSQLFSLGGQSIGVSASVLPMNTQSQFPLGLTGLISLLSKGLSKPSPVAQFESINSLVPSFLYGQSLISIFEYMNLYQQSNVSVNKGLVSKIFKQLNIKKTKQTNKQKT